ncbi:tetratricopeptide repeat protein [Hansschlegelia quercus]|nr:tetratricopeptide repeat protein [Hansschlegelia quercus]
MAAEPAPPAAAPSEPDARAKAVGELLGQLSKAQDPALAKRLAAAVQALWRRSGSDTVDLLTARSVEAQRGQKVDVAIKLMDEVVSLQPDYAEGWNRRATLHYMAKDYDEAMIDIRETLALEPRHFVAWLALGRILKESDLEAKALAAFRKALAINPWIEGLKREVDELALKVEGQPI